MPKVHLKLELTKDGVHQCRAKPVPYQRDKTLGGCRASASFWEPDSMIWLYLNACFLPCLPPCYVWSQTQALMNARPVLYF